MDLGEIKIEIKVSGQGTVTPPKDRNVFRYSFL